ncbi:MAG: ferredoxin [archaeon GB-1867-035]|nr:ferredoxin [Candidatus Culexmicrobium profundum]
MIKVKIDKTTCLGCGGCIIICPEVFEYSKEIKAQIKEEFREKIKEANIGIITDAKLIKQIKTIESLCPTHSIRIEKST